MWSSETVARSGDIAHDNWDVLHLCVITRTGRLPARFASTAAKLRKHGVQWLAVDMHRTGKMMVERTAHSIGGTIPSARCSRVLLAWVMASS